MGGSLLFPILPVRRQWAERGVTDFLYYNTYACLCAALFLIGWHDISFFGGKPGFPLVIPVEI